MTGSGPTMTLFDAFRRLWPRSRTSAALAPAEAPNPAIGVTVIPMAESPSFFRKVVRFVANPATDWADLDLRPQASRELEIEKTELRAMVERRKRNDFVRKSEFDMLRRVRREGLTGEQVASLGPSSRFDDSVSPEPDGSPGLSEDSVKAKIDAIERQMTGDEVSTRGRHPPGFYNAVTEPAMLARFQRSTQAAAGLTTGSGGIPTLPNAPRVLDFELPAPPPAISLAGGESDEVVHDPELDGAVIAFANADFGQCERALQQLIGGPRAHHADTWLALFDLYTATGEQAKHEALSVDFVQRFEAAAPAWYSLPQLVSEAVAEEHPDVARAAAEYGWPVPALLDVEAVARMRAQTLQTPLPWVFDWSALRRIDAEAAAQLSALFRVWAAQAIEMNWNTGERLDAVLREAAPVGVRDADPAFWLLRLDMLRLINRADQFDDAAMNYCVTYDVTPPPWEPARCTVRLGGAGQFTGTVPMTLISDVATTFLDTGLGDDQAAVMVANIELSGQLLGDIGPTLERLNLQLGSEPLVNVSCALLIRVDFPAAGDLLNWVLAKRGESRAVNFFAAHRLLALFFGAMGINEHARVHLRKP